MEATLFQMLAQSLKEAKAISRGDAKPAKAFASKGKNSTDASKGKLVVKKNEIPNSVVSASKIKKYDNLYRIDAKEVRELTGLSQSQFALVMNVSVKTLQNWEQHRREPTGPAEALLKIVSKEPKVALTALHT
ncbi:helix-turn-helix domain-containing protein [Janthinobacterium lividum]